MEDQEFRAVIERVVLGLVKELHPATLDGERRRECGRVAAYYLFGSSHPWDDSSHNKWRKKIEKLVVKVISELTAEGKPLAYLEFDRSRLLSAQPEAIPQQFRIGPLGVRGKPRSSPGGRSHRNRR